MEKLHIGISGLIGAGKSTLARALGEEMHLPVYYEPVVEGSYLTDFYKDQKRYSFRLQIFLLNKRFRQQQQIIWSGEGGVQDRTIYEDAIFARTLKDSGLMDDRDFRTYLEMFNNISNFMRKPNLIVHLDVTPEESLKRIKMRSRDVESEITMEYLEALHREYERFLQDISKMIPVIRVDYSRFRTAEEMAQMIKKEWDQMSNLRHVEWISGGHVSYRPSQK